MTRRKQPRDPNAKAQTPEVRRDGSDLVKAIQTTRDRIRRQVEANPVLRRQLYEDDENSLDGLTREIVDELRQFLNIARPARAKARKSRKGKKP